jgi:hypothetical protein
MGRKSAQEIIEDDKTRMVQLRDKIRGMNRVVPINEKLAMDNIVWYLMMGMSERTACGSVGCSHSTFRKWKKQGEEEKETNPTSEKAIWATQIAAAQAEGIMFLHKKAESNTQISKSNYYMARLRLLSQLEIGSLDDESEEKKQITFQEFLQNALPIFQNDPGIILKLIEKDDSGQLRKSIQSGIDSSTERSDHSGKTNGKKEMGSR